MICVTICQTPTVSSAWRIRQIPQDKLKNQLNLWPTAIPAFCYPCKNRLPPSTQPSNLAEASRYTTTYKIWQPRCQPEIVTILHVLAFHLSSPWSYWTCSKGWDGTLSNYKRTQWHSPYFCVSPHDIVIHDGLTAEERKAPRTDKKWSLSQKSVQNYTCHRSKESPTHNSTCRGHSPGCALWPSEANGPPM